MEQAQAKRLLWALISWVFGNILIINKGKFQKNKLEQARPSPVFPCFLPVIENFSFPFLTFKI